MQQCLDSVLPYLRELGPLNITCRRYQRMMATLDFTAYERSLGHSIDGSDTKLVPPALVRLSVSHAMPSGIGSVTALLFRAVTLPIPLSHASRSISQCRRTI